MLREFSLEGRTALVTGAGRGIGQGVALALAEAGADVVASARSVPQIEETAQEVVKLGRKALAIPVDVTDPAQVERLVKAAIEGMGGIDILVNSAGTIFMKPLVPLPHRNFLSEVIPGFEQGTSIEEWDGVVNLNFRGTVLVTRALAPHMIERRRGKIITITSTEAVEAWTFHSVYASTKAALVMFTRVLAREWARYGILVNAIGPGFVPTRASEFSYKDDRLRESQLQMIPLRRWGTPREVGLAAVYLASDAANYITGQTIFIDGGVSA